MSLLLQKTELHAADTMVAPKPQELADAKTSHGLHPGAGGGPGSLDFSIGGNSRKSGPA